MSDSFPSPKAAQLVSELRHFIGDLERYRHGLNRRLIYTPGVQYLAEAAGAYWLIDAVASWLDTPTFREAVREDERIGELHFWRLDVNPDRSAVLRARVDAGYSAFITQTIPYTDFPLESIDLWCAFDGEHYTLYLPSEH